LYYVLAHKAEVRSERNSNFLSQVSFQMTTQEIK